MLEIRGRRRRSRSVVCYAVWPLGELRSRRPGFTGWGFPSEEQVALADGASRTTRRCPLALTPDIWIREFVRDSGESHSGPISASPDARLRITGGRRSGSVWACQRHVSSATLGYEAVAGQDNFINVRTPSSGESSMSWMWIRASLIRAAKFSGGWLPEPAARDGASRRSIYAPARGRGGDGGTALQSTIKPQPIGA